MDEVRVQRFCARVDSSAGTELCWPWTGSRSKKGYGLLPWKGAPRMAHRFAWALEHGAMPGMDVLVCHRCDNPPCCNPKHLFLGSASDNQRDSVSKGRRAHLVGDRALRGPILSSADVIQIREARSRGASLQELAERYGVCTTTISHAGTGRNWKCLDAPTQRMAPRGPSKLTEEQERALVGLRDEGTPVVKIAERFGLSVPGTYSLLHRHGRYVRRGASRWC